jgi:hypothetical protein
MSKTKVGFIDMTGSGEDHHPRGAQPYQVQPPGLLGGSTRRTGPHSARAHSHLHRGR